MNRMVPRSVFKGRKAPRFPIEKATEAEERRAAWRRGSGLVLCEVCGFELFDHYQDPVDSFLKVACNGERIKT